MSSGLTNRVDPEQQAEIRRSEGVGEACETACEQAASPASSTICSGLLVAAATFTANEEVSTQQVSEAGGLEQLVAGYAEHRALLLR